MRYTSTSETQKENELRFYRETRRSNECDCGRGKQPGMWFCYSCHSLLPADLRRALIGAMSEAMTAAYDEAVKYLGD